MVVGLGPLIVGDSVEGKSTVAVADAFLQIAGKVEAFELPIEIGISTGIPLSSDKVNEMMEQLNDDILNITTNLGKALFSLLGGGVSISNIILNELRELKRRIIEMHGELLREHDFTRQKNTRLTESN